MADVERFSAPDGPFALRFKREDLPGLLRKRLEVPQGAVALVKRQGGEQSLLLGGAETNDLVEGVLVRERVKLALEGDAGRSKDDLAFRFALELQLRPRGTVIDLQQLERGLLQQRSALLPSEVQAWFEPHLRDAVRFYVGAREAEPLATSDQRAPLESHLRQTLQRALFDTGLELHDLAPPRFSSADLEARRQAAASVSERARALDKERELQEMKRRLDMDALLGDIEVKDEADRARKEKRLARYEQLRGRMGDDDVKALIMLLDDDRQRSRLIKELIDKDLTEDQRASMKLGEMEGRVEARLVELQQRLAQLAGLELQRRETDPITRRILCVIGKKVLAYDPKTNLHPEVPKEQHDTEKGALGYLRSVRQDRIDGQDQLLMGAQRGVYRLVGETLHEYPFPSEPEGKGGANAVAYFDGRLFATHSELGLTEWPIAGGKGRRILEADTSGQSSTRGALIQDGVLYFSAGNDVLAVDLATGSDKPTRFRGSDDSITSFIVMPGELVAGNRSGRLFRWALDDPGSPEAFPVVKKNPIYMLRHAVIAGQGFYIVGSKDFTVTAAEPRKDLYREYQAREEVRWVDGAADFIVGVSRSGYKVFCWDAHRQTEPKLVIRVSDKVQDLFLVKMLPRDAAS